MRKYSFIPDGAKVRELRLSSRLTQRELATRATCSKRAVEMIEQSHPASLELCERIAKALGTSPEAIAFVGKNVISKRDSSGDKYDVFISYSNKDKTWVRGELLTRIEESGLRAFVDFRDFEPGAPSIQECERGLKECRKTVLVLTPHYLESQWNEFENLLFQNLDSTNRDRRLLPLLKDGCKKPFRIGALTHIDFTSGADEDFAWRQLLTALGRPPEPNVPKETERKGWFLAHPYPMPPNFTGRTAERITLSRWLDTDDTHPLLVLRALGGFGKSALVWHWLTHDVDASKWSRVVWWSFYEVDASFENFLAKSLHYLNGRKIESGRVSTEDIETLLRLLGQPSTLLVLDGFERVLRAFGGLNAAYQGDEAKSEASERDCISPLAELFLYNLALQPRLCSKVLLTTRLYPRVLETRSGDLLQGCQGEELMQMQPADAVTFFRAQGVRGNRGEIEEACAPYGYHPLSLRLLAGLIARDFEQPGDVAAAKRLDLSGDLVQRQHHVLETAFDSLTLEKQILLGRIACFRSPVSYAALQALAETSVTLEIDLRDLVGRGLLHHDTREGRFDLHPIVRRYAYDRLAGPERARAHTRLRDYFAAVPNPEKVTRVEDLAPVIELYHHTVRAGQLDEAFTLFRDRLFNLLYYQFGICQLIIDLVLVLFPDGEDRPPRLKDESDQGWTLNVLANCYSRSGQPRRAVSLFEHSCALAEKRSDKHNLVIGLAAVAPVALLPIGALRVAEANLRRSISLCREIKEDYDEAIGHRELGRLLAYRGAYAESETELRASTAYWKKTNEVQEQCVVEAYRAMRELLLLSCPSRSAERDPQNAIDAARRALELADETARTSYPYERDYVEAHWLLGAARRFAGEHDEAERHLHEALERCRRINLVEHEADILIDLARLRRTSGAEKEARRLAEEALVITERSGYVLQGADARLELAKLARDGGEKDAALAHAREARRLATCDGPPDYTYKAAHEEARDLIEELEGQAKSKKAKGKS